MRGINKHFGAVVALKDASLSIEPGKITALLGSNGSGKSTMVKILAGLYSKNSGEILMDGKPVDIRSGQDSARLGIATAFQDLSLVPTMSVLDNMLLGREPQGRFGLLDRKKAAEEVRALLDRFKIDCDPHAYVQTLMPSTQSMLEVAKAVLKKPRLLLDEVTATLHHDEITVLFSVLKQLRDEGLSMVYVTHRMNEIFEICDSATIMRSGETIISSPVSELTLPDIVFYMTGKRPEVNAGFHEARHDVNAGDQTPVLDVQHLEIDPKVRDISIRAYPGEIVGIGGLEGQGQGELIRAVLGDIAPDKGAIAIEGKPCRFKSPADGIRMGTGFVSGERNREAIFADRTISENLFAANAAKGSRFRFLPASEVRNFSQTAVEKYSIKIGQLRDPASSLSGGNQQKLAAARWIAMSPRLLLLDDPTKGVDIHSRLEIHDILRRCADEGMTVLISASDTDELLAISDRIYVFYEGRVSGMLAGDAKNAENLVACMMGMTGQGAGKEGERA